MRADNSHHLRAAAHRRAIQTRQRAVEALRRLERAGAPITFEVVAREAGVSRSWLYAQPDLHAEIQRLRAACRDAPASPPIPARQRASEASLRRWLEQHFRDNNIASGKFSHYLPAAYFLREQATLLPRLDSATLERVEKLFRRVNELLPQT